MPETSLRAEALGGGVVRLTIDNPPANALTTEIRLELAAAWKRLQDDAAVAAVIVTGANGRFFSAGLDLGELGADLAGRLGPDELHAKIDRLLWDPLSAGLYKPVIAAVNGYCVAGGWALAQMCDVRLAAESATFGIPEAGLGLPAIFTVELAEMLPPNLAAEAALWAGRRFPARRMAEIGFVNLVVPDADLEATAIAWAREVAALPAAAVQAHKRLLYLGRLERSRALRAEAERTVRPLYDLPDAAERVGAFHKRAAAR